MWCRSRCRLYGSGKAIYPILCELLFKTAGQTAGHGEKAPAPGGAKDPLDAYHWPGNVRELENLMERMVVLAEGPELIPGDLPVHMQEHCR
jgi:DNA-binding NtrC family response regulator